MSQKELASDCEQMEQSQVETSVETCDIVVNRKRNETKTEKKIMQLKKKMIKSKTQSTVTEKRKTRSKYRLAARVAAEALKKTACTRLHRQTQEKNKNTKSRKRLQRKTAAASFEILYRFKKQSNPEKEDEIADEPLHVTQAILKSDESSCENSSEIEGPDSENIKKECSNHKFKKPLEKETPCQEEYSKIEDNENQSHTSALQSCSEENVENVVITKKRSSQNRPCQEEFSKNEDYNLKQSLSSTLQSCSGDNVENVVTTKKRRHSVIDLSDTHQPGKCQKVLNPNEEVATKKVLENADNASNIEVTNAKETYTVKSNVQSNTSLAYTGSAHSVRSNLPSKQKKKLNVRTIACQTKHTHLPTDSTICEFCQKPCSFLSKPTQSTVTPPRNQNASISVVTSASPLVSGGKADPQVIPVKKIVSVLPAPSCPPAPGTVLKVVNTASPGVFQVYVPPDIRFPNGIATFKLQQHLQYVASPGPSFNTVQLNNTSSLSGSGSNPSVQNATNIRAPIITFVRQAPQSQVRQLLLRPRGPTATPQQSIAPKTSSNTLGCSTRVTQATAVTNVYATEATSVNQRLNIQNENLKSLPVNSQMVHMAVKTSGLIAVPSSGPLTALCKITESLKPTNAIKQSLASYSLNQSDWNTCEGQWSIAEVLEHIVNSDFLISSDLLSGIDEGTNSCRGKSFSDTTRCCHCSRVFPDSQLLMNHSLLHSVDGLLECLLCGVLFVNINLFEKHVRLHKVKEKASKEGQVIFSGNAKPFTCALCQKKFVYLCDLAKHRFNHQQQHSKGVPIHQCTRCNKQFTQQSQLIVHRILNHEDAVMTKCFFCGRQLREADQLVKHIQKVHLGRKSIQTTSCSTDSKQSRAFGDQQVSVAVSLSAISAVSRCVAPTADAVINGAQTAKLTASNATFEVQNVCGSPPSSASPNVNIVVAEDTHQGNLCEIPATADTNQCSPSVAGGNNSNETSTENEIAQQQTLPGKNSDDQMETNLILDKEEWKGEVSSVLYRCSVCTVKFETASEFAAHCNGCRDPSATAQRKYSRCPYSNVAFCEQSHDSPSHVINCRDNPSEKIIATQEARKCQEKTTTSISELSNENLCQSSLSSNTKANQSDCRNGPTTSISESSNENLRQNSLSSNAKANQTNCRNGYKCHSCKIAFKTALELATHVRQSQDLESGSSANDGRKFVCSSCKLTFRNAADLANHISNYKVIVRKKVTEKSKLGDSMGKSIDPQERLNSVLTDVTVHTHDSCEDKLSGNVSDKRSTDFSKNTLSKVVTNLNSNSGGSLAQAATVIFECKGCRLNFHSLKELRNHKKAQHLCKVCKAEFSLISELLAHFDASHCGLKYSSPKSAPKLICKVCDKRFHTAGGLFDHFKKHQQL